MSSQRLLRHAGLCRLLNSPKPCGKSLKAIPHILKRLRVSAGVKLPYLHSGIITSETVLYNGLSLLQPSSDAPSAWLAIAAIVGLPIVLWTYKCLMMVIFQRKIIYMGYVPPGSRSERLGVDVRVPKGLQCEEIQIQSDKRIKLCGIIVERESASTEASKPDIVLIYLQGNAGNSLARLPVFQRLLLGMPFAQAPRQHISVVAAAPRSYWRSSSRTPTERGILTDYTHILSYTVNRYPDVPIVLYGHSLGGAIAVCLTARLKASDYPTVKGLILENPFASIPGMVRALYPQRWLPYHYLAPLAFDKWDAVAAMRSVDVRHDSLLARLSRNVLVLLSEKDEIVPTSMGDDIYQASESLKIANKGLPAHPLRRKVVIRDALHQDAWTTRQWVAEVTSYLGQISQPTDK